MTAYKSLTELIELIDEPNKSKCEQLLSNHEEKIKASPGSKEKHHAWPGGYVQHVEEVMNLAVQLYPVISHLRRLPFTLSDALLILFFHDIEKPFKYEYKDGLKVNPELADKSKHHEFRMKLLKEYGIALTPDQENALKYVEGENQDYHPTKRIMNELATFCHLCDVTSARIWYNYPYIEERPWKK